jgi:hypothetical protein
MSPFHSQNFSHAPPPGMFTVYLTGCKLAGGWKIISKIYRYDLLSGDQPEPKAKPNNSSDENCVGECQLATFIRRDRLASCPYSRSDDINMTCGTVSSDDHPINIKGSKRP